MEIPTSNGHQPKTADEIIGLIHNPPPNAAPSPPRWTSMDGVGNQVRGAAPAPAPTPLARPDQPAPIAAKGEAIADALQALKGNRSSIPQPKAPLAAIANILRAFKGRASIHRAGGKSNPIERLIAVAAIVSLGAWLSTGKGIAGFMAFQGSYLWLYLSVALLLAAVMKWQQSKKMDLLNFSLLAIAMASIAMLSGFLGWLLLGALLAAALIWAYTDLTNGGGIEYHTPIVAAVTAIALLAGAGEILPRSPQQPINQPIDQQNVG